MKFCVFLCLCYYLRYGSAQLSNGDDCENNAGKCIPLKNCAPTLQAFQNGVYPDTCGFEQNQPLVCCKTEESPSVRNCKKYAAASTASFPAFEVFSIVGGQATLPKELPHMAALGYKNGENIIFLCGGSLISDQYILTAAHCLSSLQYGPVQMVRLGDINISPNSLVTTSKDYKVSKRIYYPYYASPSVYNDIALIQLETRVEFNNFIKPACLYNNKVIPPNMELIASGWGLTEFAGNKSDTLLKVDLELFTDKECVDHYSKESARRLRYGIVTHTQFCAGARNSNKDACQGDSGGPLQTYNSTQRIYSIVGITSFGKACGIANIPGVYTRVSFFVSWLESIIWPSN